MQMGAKEILERIDAFERKNYELRFIADEVKDGIDRFITECFPEVSTYEENSMLRGLLFNYVIGKCYE